MKPILLSITSSALVLGASLSAMAAAPDPAPIIEGKDKPILLARLVVRATPLPR